MDQPLRSSRPRLPRVGLVGPIPPPFGGMANQCLQLAELLRSEGVYVEIVAVNAAYRPAWIGRLKAIRAIARLLPYLHELWRMSGRVEVVHLFANSGWAWHLFACPAILTARLRAVPVIVNYRGGNAEPFFAAAPAWVQRTLGAASSLVVPSGFLEQVFRRFGFSARVIPNIINLERFRPRPPESRRAAPNLLVTRNLERIYDIRTAIRALAIVHRRFPSARLTVAGSGPELPALRTLSAEVGVGDQVSFLGRVDNKDVPALYGAADVMVNPSLVDNMPVSILEAFASGVPVVSTDVGGVPFIAEHGCSALLVPPGQPGAMATAILEVLSDPELAARLVRAGQAEAARYSWGAIRELWFTEYARVAIRREPAAERP